MIWAKHGISLGMWYDCNLRHISYHTFGHLLCLYEKTLTGIVMTLCIISPLDQASRGPLPALYVCRVRCETYIRSRLSLNHSHKDQLILFLIFPCNHFLKKKVFQNSHLHVNWIFSNLVTPFSGEPTTSRVDWLTWRYKHNGIIKRYRHGINYHTRYL